ncbi:MAG: hypothetical protein BGO26_20220 [Actinobacteria bacterium 69-20]|nr:MAG: hypothetical protein BGO26_20220 [Actinobacteria bacterium 69-20]
MRVAAGQCLQQERETVDTHRGVGWAGQVLRERGIGLILGIHPAADIRADQDDGEHQQRHQQFAHPSIVPTPSQAEPRPHSADPAPCRPDDLGIISGEVDAAPAIRPQRPGAGLR